MNPSADSPANLEVVLDIPVELSVELGTCHLPMRQVLQLEPGSIVQLDKTADAPVDVFVNRKLVARGEVVVLEDRLGIRVTHIVGMKPAAVETPVAPEPRGSTPLRSIDGKLP